MHARPREKCFPLHTQISIHVCATFLQAQREKGRDRSGQTGSKPVIILPLWWRIEGRRSQILLLRVSLAATRSMATGRNRRKRMACRRKDALETPCFYVKLSQQIHLPSLPLFLSSPSHNSRNQKLARGRDQEEGDFHLTSCAPCPCDISYQNNPGFSGLLRARHPQAQGILFLLLHAYGSCPLLQL